jgi:hypothetical protein
VLTSRIWRSGDPQLNLSDGGDPATGVCPGYVTAVVFVRNLQVTLRAAATTPSAPVTTDLRFTLAANKLTARPLKINEASARKILDAQPAVTANTARAFSKLDQQSFVVASTVAAKPNVALRSKAATSKLDLQLKRAVVSETLPRSILVGAVGATVLRAEPAPQVQQPPPPAPAPAPAPAPPRMTSRSSRSSASACLKHRTPHLSFIGSNTSDNRTV